MNLAEKGKPRGSEVDPAGPQVDLTGLRWGAYIKVMCFNKKWFDKPKKIQMRFKLCESKIKYSSKTLFK